MTTNQVCTYELRGGSSASSFEVKLETVTGDSTDFDVKVYVFSHLTAAFELKGDLINSSL
jgi:hypothetical protein